MGDCIGCRTRVEGEYNYCPNCGEKNTGDNYVKNLKFFAFSSYVLDNTEIMVMEMPPMRNLIMGVFSYCDIGW